MWDAERDGPRVGRVKEADPSPPANIWSQGQKYLTERHVSGLFMPADHLQQVCSLSGSVRWDDTLKWTTNARTPMLFPQLALTEVEVDTWIRGQVGTLGHLTFPFLIWQPLSSSFIPLFLSLCLRPALCDSPHVKTDLVAGRILPLCVPAALIAVLWWLSLPDSLGYIFTQH